MSTNHTCVPLLTCTHVSINIKMLIMAVFNMWDLNFSEVPSTKVIVDEDRCHRVNKRIVETFVLNGGIVDFFVLNERIVEFSVLSPCEVRSNYSTKQGIDL